MVDTAFTEFAPSRELAERFQRNFNSLTSIGILGWLMRIGISFQESSELLTTSTTGALSGLAEIVTQRNPSNRPMEIVGTLHDLLIGAVATRLGRPSITERLEIAKSLILELKQQLSQNQLEVNGATFSVVNGQLFLRLLPSLTPEEILENPHDWKIDVQKIS